MSGIHLTQTVKKGGCAAKIPASDLSRILSSLRLPPTNPDILVDGKLLDDAAVTRISDSLASIHTLDFFTPIVDSPYLFGAIAAANALSDVYAMGGIPKYCLAILAFPATEFHDAVVLEIMQGACNKIAEANAALVGGHSIDDETLKFGLSVYGTVDPRRTWTNAGIRTGDHLILTKPLGTGTLCAGLKRQVYTEENITEATSSMTRLNNIPDILNEELQRHIHAATDITGFGLAGHAMQMAKASDKSLVFDTEMIPLFKMTLDSLKREHLTRAHRTNAEYTKHFILAPRDSLQALTIFDPQTSGGLLLSVASEQSQKIIEKLKPHFPSTTRIGRCLDRQSHEPFVVFE